MILIILYYSTTEHKIQRNNFWKALRRSDPRRHLFTLAKKRAKQNNLNFSISLDNIVIHDYCPILNIKIIINNKMPEFNSPSLDRINNLKGYEPDNIIIVSRKVNTIKNDATLTEMKLIYNNYFNISDNINHNVDRKKNNEGFYSAKKRAKKSKLEFNIERSDILYVNICPILNIPLSFSKSYGGPNSPSLDRIDNTKGYIKGNIRIISKRANTLKNNSTFEEYEKIYKFYKNLKENTNGKAQLPSRN